MSHAVLSVLIGLATGVLSGVFGIGGAFLSTPAIRLGLGVPAIIAVGTPLPVVIPSAVAAGVVYWRRDLVERSLVLPVSAGGVAGSLAGSYATGFISGHVLLVITGVLIAAVSAQFLYGTATGKGSLKNADYGKSGPRFLIPHPALRIPQFKAVMIGLAAGLVSGLLGIGGAVILNPAFVFLLKVPIRRAFGTSLIVIAILAVPGSVVHYALGHIDPRLALLLAVGVVPGGYIGARIAGVAKSRTLAYAFGAFLAMSGVVLGLTELYPLLAG